MIKLGIGKAWLQAAAKTSVYFYTWHTWPWPAWGDLALGAPITLILARFLGRAATDTFHSAISILFLVFFAFLVFRYPFLLLGLRLLPALPWLGLGLLLGSLEATLGKLISIYLSIGGYYFFHHQYLARIGWLQLLNLGQEPQTLETFLTRWQIYIFDPLREELYRSYLFIVWERLTGMWPVLLVSAALFGLSHTQYGWPGKLNVTLIGIAYGLAYLKTRSLWLPIGLHVGFNVIGVLPLPPYVNVFGELVKPVIHMGDWGFTLENVVLILVLLVLPLRPFRKDWDLWNRYLNPTARGRNTRSRATRA